MHCALLYRQYSAAFESQNSTGKKVKKLDEKKLKRASQNGPKGSKDPKLVFGFSLINKFNPYFSVTFRLSSVYLFRRRATSASVRSTPIPKPKCGSD